MRNPTSSSPASATEAAESGAGGAKSTPCCSKVGLKRGPWTPEEDELLSNYINKEGEGRWRTLPKRAGLLRCGKSCRLRWMNYLRPSVKRGHIAADEEDLILRLHRLLGNRWSLIAGRIPGRTDNEIKNYWNTHLSKKLISQGIDPRTHKPLSNVQITNCNSATTKQKDINTLSTSKAAATHPNPNQMHPTYNSDNSNSTGVLVGAVHGREDGQQTHHLFHMKENSTNAEFCFDLTRNSTTYDPNANALVSPCKSTINASHHHDDHHPNYNASFTGITNKNNDNVCGESPRSFEDQDQDPNYCNDDVFSSFLNSLINEEMFTPQGQQQLPRYDALQLGTQPNINPAFGAPAGWDAAPTSAAGFHHGISPDDQPL